MPTALRVLRKVAAASVAITGACSAPNTVTRGPMPDLAAGAAVVDAVKAYQPLGPGDSWTYICDSQFHIVDHVIGTLHLDKRLVYVFSLQIPSSPTKSVYVDQLLANDSGANTWIYGYYMHHKVKVIRPAKIVVQHPVLNAHYDYPGPLRGTISRIFVGFEYTNRTPLGTFWVAPYFESGATHNYGYSQGRGVMEEDHGPNYQYDCLIEKYVLH